MSTAISGIGLVTPFGADLEEIWARLSNGIPAEAQMLASEYSTRTYPYLPVPPKTLRTIERHPRLRRSSEISHFAVLAGLNALADAGIDAASCGENIGVVFAISSGGVRYTSRFYEQIVAQGAATASPLLFPETVYNAPASHLAALLGIDGISYTLVGDSAVGMPALSLAADLLETGQLDHCVVVSSEEAHWILCEALHSWRFFRPANQVRAFASPAERGTAFSEGAGAVVLSRKGPVSIEKISPCLPWFRSAEMGEVLQRALAALPGSPDAIFASANGTALDDAEKSTFETLWPGRPVHAVKNSFGESLGAGALQQFAAAVLALRHGHLPGDSSPIQSVAVSCLGYNAQAGGVFLRI